MRAGLLLSLTMVLALPWSATAQEAEARAVIDKAVKAQGGEKLAKTLKSTQAKGKGTIHVMEMVLDFTMEMFNNLPDQTKVVIQLSIMGMNIDVINVVNGDKGWASAAGMLTDLDADQIKEAKEQMYVESVTSLYPLKEKDKGFTFGLLGETKVGDTPALGVTVSKKDKKDVNLFFDKKTHVLLKAEYRAIDPFSKQEVTQEKYFADYKEMIPGMKSACKLTVKNDSKPFLEMELTEVRAVDRHDASIFAKPNVP